MLQDKVEDAKNKHVDAFLDSINRNENCDDCPGEADDRLNESCRHVIQAMFDTHGEAWLGNINLYEDGHQPEDDDGFEPPHRNEAMWLWSGKRVLNFGCVFVLPKRNETIEKMILSRRDARYLSGEEDCRRIAEISKAIKDAGGIYLCWS